jgi:hypothetical protein
MSDASAYHMGTSQQREAIALAIDNRWDSMLNAVGGIVTARSGNLVCAARLTITGFRFVALAIVWDVPRPAGRHGPGSRTGAHQDGSITLIGAVEI